MDASRLWTPGSPTLTRLVPIEEKRNELNTDNYNYEVIEPTFKWLIRGVFDEYVQLGVHHYNGDQEEIYLLTLNCPNCTAHFNVENSTVPCSMDHCVRGLMKRNDKINVNTLIIGEHELYLRTYTHRPRPMRNSAGHRPPATPIFIAGLPALIKWLHSVPGLSLLERELAGFQLMEDAVALRPFLIQSKKALLINRQRLDYSRNGLA